MLEVGLVKEPKAYVEGSDGDEGGGLSTIEKKEKRGGDSWHAKEE